MRQLALEEIGDGYDPDDLPRDDDYCEQCGGPCSLMDDDESFFEDDED